MVKYCLRLCDIWCGFHAAWVDCGCGLHTCQYRRIVTFFGCKRTTLTSDESMKSDIVVCITEREQWNNQFIIMAYEFEMLTTNLRFVFTSISWAILDFWTGTIWATISLLVCELWFIAVHWLRSTSMVFAQDRFKIWFAFCIALMSTIKRC